MHSRRAATSAATISASGAEEVLASPGCTATSASCSSTSYKAPAMVSAIAGAAHIPLSK